MLRLRVNVAFFFHWQKIIANFTVHSYLVFHEFFFINIETSENIIYRYNNILKYIFFLYFYIALYFQRNMPEAADVFLKRGIDGFQMLVRPADYFHGVNVKSSSFFYTIIYFCIYISSLNFNFARSILGFRGSD